MPSMVQWAMNEPVAVRILSRLPFSRSKPSRAAYCGLKTQNVLAVSSLASIGIIVSRSDESQTSIVMPSASLRYLIRFGESKAPTTHSQPPINGSRSSWMNVTKGNFTPRVRAWAKIGCGSSPAPTNRSPSSTTHLPMYSCRCALSHS